MKHIWVSGIKIEQLQERHENLRNLKWLGDMHTAYSVHIFPNKSDTGGIISCSDAFGGGVAWATYEGQNKIIGKVMGSFDKDETEFLQRKYPVFLNQIKNLDA